MIKIGKFNKLKVIKLHKKNIYLDAGDSIEILLEKTETPTQCEIGDKLNVFVYGDIKSGLKATIQTPYAQVDDIAWLKVKEINNTGAFLDWGLSKDLLLPYGEQTQKVAEGRSCLVKLFLDKENRITASMLLDDFIQDEAFYFKEGQKVEIIIADETDLGRKAIVNNQFWGVLYKNEIFQRLRKGQKTTAYIKKIREDNKLDLVFQMAKFGEKVDSVTKKILAKLEAQDGIILINDKSHPDDIYKAFAVSKKVFKQSIGGLYKQRIILINKTGISLLNKKDEL
ncbi:MAG: GntR family transcriptional regulator [Methylococcales symbiont of Iophon sp. n. MRB-2018]|nr:MAG: GntR family transcriptional regulator [Methylococcales symbiont of Iophon sp. n. MRB-2018]KAF3979939.1 MAG: GntR family transcriptional regulator [Methylococcales symbiont of Iophon sp. n. MRB-2018]